MLEIVCHSPVTDGLKCTTEIFALNEPFLPDGITTPEKPEGADLDLEWLWGCLADISLRVAAASLELVSRALGHVCSSTWGYTHLLPSDLQPSHWPWPLLQDVEAHRGYGSLQGSSFKFIKCGNKLYDNIVTSSLAL